ncbi:hypothetical protein N0V90_013513 [Kalmusia sp. IMI 367209]|nr:hypothetical protein N0V90_013513 [Kalmusia sp. IMI 367209]
MAWHPPKTCSKKILMYNLGLVGPYGVQAYKALRAEALKARDALAVDHGARTAKAMRDHIAPPYKLEHLEPNAVREMRLAIVKTASPQTQEYYAKGHCLEGDEPDNWVAAWFQYHSFRRIPTNMHDNGDLTTATAQAPSASPYLLSGANQNPTEGAPAPGPAPASGKTIEYHASFRERQQGASAQGNNQNPTGSAPTARRVLATSPNFLPEDYLYLNGVPLATGRTRSASLDSGSDPARSPSPVRAPTPPRGGRGARASRGGRGGRASSSSRASRASSASGGSRASRASGQALASGSASETPQRVLAPIMPRAPPPEVPRFLPDPPPKYDPATDAPHSNSRPDGIDVIHGSEGRYFFVPGVPAAIDTPRTLLPPVGTHPDYRVPLASAPVNPIEWRGHQLILPRMRTPTPTVVVLDD